jgi:hypothetical protein
VTRPLRKATDRATRTRAWPPVRRVISALSAAVIPGKRNWASKSCSLSRIVVSLGVKGEEVADHSFESDLLEASTIEQAELQSLFDGGEERTGGIGALTRLMAGLRLGNTVFWSLH